MPLPGAEDHKFGGTKGHNKGQASAGEGGKEEK